MKRIIKLSLILTTVLLSIISCSDNFLKPEPLSFYAPENIYVDKAGFEALLVTMRKSLVSETSGGRGRSLMLPQWSHSEAAVTEFLLDDRTLTPNLSPDRYEHVAMINTVYGFIKNANVIVSRIDDIEWQSQQDRNEVLAEAMWHRAYWYYRLVHTYGDVPFVGKEIQSARVDFNTHSRWAILDKIQEDMEFAVQHLPESAIPGAITRGAGNHLLAKISLANMNFDNAITAATRVIDGPYALMTQRFGQDADDPKRNVIWDLHRPDNKNLPGNTETILAIVDRFEAPDDAKSRGSRTMRSYHCDWWHSRHRDSEGNRGMIDEGPMYDSLGRGNPDAALSEWYQYNIWEEDGNTWDTTPDLRRADINWADIQELRYNNPESVNFGEQWRLEWMTGEKARVLSSIYAMPIYKTMIPEKDPAARPMGGHGDMYIYRLAETYLLRAEAYYWKDNLAAAAADINTVRARAQAPLITAGDVTIDYIFDERVRELFVETPRQNELARVSFTMAELGMNGYSPETLHENNWAYDRRVRLNYFYPNHPKSGMSATGIPYPVGDQFVILGQSPRAEPHTFLWPIDANLINSNTLGRINQNRGYDGAENNQPPLETIEE